MRYAIMYRLERDFWTYTSCHLFGSQQEAIDHFPYKGADVICTLKVKRIKIEEQE